MTALFWYCLDSYYYRLTSKAYEAIVIGVRMFRKESMKYWFSSFKKAISFRMAKEWDKNQYNKSIPAVENKIGNNSLWVVVTAIIEVYNDVIIKYFILICFLVTSLGELIYSSCSGLKQGKMHSIMVSWLYINKFKITWSQNYLFFEGWYRECVVYM